MGTHASFDGGGEVVLFKHVSPKPSNAEAAGRAVRITEEGSGRRDGAPQRREGSGLGGMSSGSPRA